MNDTDPTKPYSALEYVNPRMEKQLGDSLKDVMTVRVRQDSRWLKEGNEGRPVKYLHFNNSDETIDIPADSTMARIHVEELRIEQLPQTDNDDECITVRWTLSDDFSPSDIFRFTLHKDGAVEVFVDAIDEYSQRSADKEYERPSATRLLQEEALTLNGLIIAASELLEAESPEA